MPAAVSLPHSGPLSTSCCHPLCPPGTVPADDWTPSHSFACYSLAFSPFYPNKLAVAGAANFGLVGNGRLSVAAIQDGPQQSVPPGQLAAAGAMADGMAIEKGCVACADLHYPGRVDWEPTRSTR